MLTWIERIRIGTPPMIVRHGVGDRRHLRVVRIDVERDPDDDGAVVVRPGQRRGDRDEAERRALEGAGQVHLADRVEGWAPGPAATLRGPDLRLGRAARGWPARRVRALRGGGDRASGQ